MKATFKYYLLLLFCSITFSAIAQEPAIPHIIHLPLDKALAIIFIDSNTRTPVVGGVIDLKVKDRLVLDVARTTVELTLAVKNISEETIIVPGYIECFDDGGFNCPGKGTALLPGNSKNIPLRLNCSRRDVFRRAGFVTVYFMESGYVRYPIQVVVHFNWQNSSPINKRQ